MTHGLDGNGLILKMRQPFLDKLKVHIDERRLKLIEPFVYSIDHKLNVARYSAGLIRAVEPRDYNKHYAKRDQKTSTKKHTKVEYSKRCIYYAYDWDQYSLELLFFVESFAAAAISLFDTSGHLLTDMYNLSLRPEEADFHKATKEIQIKAPRLYSFLANFIVDDPTCSEWFKRLKKLRNSITHREVTQILMLGTPYPPHQQQILLLKNAISAPDNLVVHEFIEQCFNGLEEYVEGLYDRLARQVDAERSLPLTGRHDHLI